MAFSYITFDKCSDLTLDCLGLSQQALINRQLLQFARTHPDMVGFGIPVTSYALEQVVRVTSYVCSLGLH